MKKVNSTCIIDDDPIFIYGTKRIMKESNFANEILVYNNGQDAIDGLLEISNQDKELPDIIFLDLNMPLMTGWEFLEAFVKIPMQKREKVVIYIVSSSVDPRDLQKVQDYNIIHKYILKPVSPQDLESVLANIALA